MADTRQDVHASRWYMNVPKPDSEVVVSWETPDGSMGMTWCTIDPEGKVVPKSVIPSRALLFGWCYDR